jgi:hypothetical protein
MRLADGRDVLLPTRVISPGHVIVDTSGLPIAGRDMIVRVQLGAPNIGEPLSMPLQTYAWSAQAHPAAYFERQLRVKVEAEKALYGALETVRVRWSGIDEPARFDWIGIYPAGDPKAARRTYKLTGGSSAGSMDMQPMFVPGKYDLRVFRDNNWDLLGVSAPFEVIPVLGKIALSKSQAAAGSPVTVTWSGLNYPNRKDWVGVFPKGSNDVVIGTQTQLGGDASGEAAIRIAADTAPGAYEARLYSSGGWTLLATQPLTITAR